MAGKLKNSSKNLNPNWAQLLELKSSEPKNKYPKHSRGPDTETHKNVLGKRKERSDEDSEALKPNPLTPTSSDCSLTDVVAMDCEMVGVGSLGNKSVLGESHWLTNGEMLYMTSMFVLWSMWLIFAQKLVESGRMI